MGSDLAKREELNRAYVLSTQPPKYQMATFSRMEYCYRGLDLQDPRTLCTDGVDGRARRWTSPRTLCTDGVDGRARRWMSLRTSRQKNPGFMGFYQM